jgi:hypothetical protein
VKYFLLLLAIILLTTCTPKEEEGPLYLIGQSTKDYLVFPVGSYWVYEEETSNFEDSLYLYRLESKIIKKGRTVGYNSDRIDFYAESSFYDDTLTSSIDKHFSNDLDQCGQFYLKNFINGDYIFFNRNQCYDSIEFTSNNYLVRDCRDSVRVILGSTYRECIEFRDKYSGNVLVYSRGVGLIRKEESSGKIWNLKKYFINK